MGVGVQCHAPTTSTPGKSPDAHGVGSWVGLMAGLGWCGENLSLPPG